MSQSAGLISQDFEVFGKVQGVFFRKYTRMKAKELGLRGYVRNTESGTVVGTLQGSPASVNLMKDWLRTKGSPQSRIDKTVFSEQKSISSPTYGNFDIDRS